MNLASDIDNVLIEKFRINNVFTRFAHCLGQLIQISKNVKLITEIITNSILIQILLNLKKSINPVI